MWAGGTGGVLWAWEHGSADDAEVAAVMHAGSQRLGRRQKATGTSINAARMTTRTRITTTTSLTPPPQGVCKEGDWLIVKIWAGWDKDADQEEARRQCGVAK